jgi:type VI secretion system protein ImpL
MTSFIALLKKLPIKKLGPAAGIVLGAITVLVLGYRLRWWQRLYDALGVWFWVLMLCLMGLAVLLLLVWYLPRWREKRFLGRLQPEEAKTPQDLLSESQKKLQDKFQQAIRTLQNAPGLRKKGSMPLYALPWYLLLGASQSGKTTLLQGVASHLAPFAHLAASTEGTTQDCDWWFFNTAVVLDTAASFAFPGEIERDGAQWYRFLQLLRKHRELLPINGMLLTVAADKLLLHPTEQLRHEAVELRQRIHEAMDQLEVDFPVYLLVTRCDLIDGFTEFFGKVPKHTLNQVFGHIYEARPPNDDQQVLPTEALAFESTFGAWVERLYQLQLSMLNEEDVLTGDLRQKIFCFPEEFRALREPLRTFIDSLLFVSPTLHTPFFRGLFFCSGVQQGLPVSSLRRQLPFDSPGQDLEKGRKAYFLYDLFGVILWNHQSLARTRMGPRWRRFVRHLFGFGGSLMLGLILVVLLAHAFISDQQARAGLDPAQCHPTTVEVGTRPLLDEADRCRQTVQTLSTRNASRPAWGKLVFNRSGRLERDLRRQYVEKFRAEVLTLLDAGIVQGLQGASDSVPNALVLIQRIGLINECLSLRRCPRPIAPDKQPAYALMLAPSQQGTASPQQISTLERTYEAYLLWALDVPEVLPRERAELANHLLRWFTENEFAPEQIMRWVNQQYASVRLQDYWRDLPETEATQASQVEAAYTAKAWQQSIAPFLQRATEAVPRLQAELETFEQQYRASYFEAWRRFLDVFPEGETPWWRTRGRRHELASLFMQDDSPYQRILDDTYAQLTPLLPTVLVAETPEATPVPDAVLEAAEHQIPAWVRILRRYRRSESRVAYEQAVGQLAEKLRGQASQEASFELATAGYQAGETTDASTHPVLKALRSVRHFRAQHSTGDTSEEVIWPLLERPVLFIWKVILEDAAAFLHKIWQEDVITPMKGLAPMEQVELLYGEGGKVRQFVQQYAEPFLVNNESGVGQVLGEQVPLSEAFLQTLQKERQFRPLLEIVKQIPQRVTVEILRKPYLNGTKLREVETTFEVRCGRVTSKATHQTSGAAETETVVPWSFDGCGPLDITVTMACNQSCVEVMRNVGNNVPAVSDLRLRKRYKNTEGFLQFVEDFKDGEQVFSLDDFAESYPPPLWEEKRKELMLYDFTSLRIYLQVEVPSTLAKLVSLMSSEIVAKDIMNDGQM